MTTIYVKQNDTAPTLVVNLVDDDGAAVDITGASVRFHMRKPGAASAKVDSSATLVTGDPAQVSYAWQSGDLDTEGRFEAEFEVTYSGGAVETFPNDSFIDVIVRRDLA